MDTWVRAGGVLLSTGHNGLVLTGRSCCAMRYIGTWYGFEREGNIEAWQATPLTDEEMAFGQISDWGPAEDWSDWADATR